MADPEQQVRDWLAAYTAPTASVAHLLCDRHDPTRTAVTEVLPDLSAATLTFGDLSRRAADLAAALAEHGVGVGDRVATLLPLGIDLTVSAVAAWRLGAVLVPLPPVLAASAVDQRLRQVAASAVVAPAEQSGKLAADAPWAVLDPDQPPAEKAPDPVAVGPDAPLLISHTPGVSGPPRQITVPVRALTAFHIHHHYGLGVRDDDLYWCFSEPGDPHGLYYGLVSPLLAGHACLHLRAGFDPELTLDVLETFGVTRLAAAPTVYRALRSATKTLPPGIMVQGLASNGDALRADLTDWALGTFGVGISDHYGHAESGIVAVNDGQGGPLEALPGFRLAVLDPLSDTPADVGVPGRVAVDTVDSPAWWFDGYPDDPLAAARRFSPDGRWYLTGDTGTADESGAIHLTRHDGEVIITSGYRIGPYDVESVLLEHDAVDEVAVYGLPDPERGALVAANVVPAPGASPGEELAEELKRLVAERFAETAVPQRLTFVPHLPKTASGKLRRNRLRASAA